MPAASPLHSLTLTLLTLTLLTLHPTTTLAITHPTLQTHISKSNHSIPYDHVVYVGDSILRYQLLAFLHEVHHGRSPPTNLTFNDGPVDENNRKQISLSGYKNGKWGYYLHHSTDMFEGYMVCDCYRGIVMGKSKDIVENRYYRHPNGKFYVSYYQKFGDSPAKGKVKQSDMRIYNTLEEAMDGVWWANTYRTLFMDHVRHLTPAPTVLILNQKPWVTPFRKSTILQDLPDALTAALQIVDTVIWLQGAPTLPELKTMKAEGSYDIGPVDKLVRDVLCNKENSRRVKVTRHHLEFSCTYLEFPVDVLTQMVKEPEKYYHDFYHFSDPMLYLRRNSEALKFAGVSHHLD